MLGPGHVKALKVIDGTRNRADLMDNLKVTKGTLSRTLRDLVWMGFIEHNGERNGPVLPRMTTHARLFRSLLRLYDRVPWEGLITHGTLDILSCLTRLDDDGIPRSVPPGLVALMTGKSRSTIHTTFRRLSPYGIIVGSDGYQLNRNHTELRRFIDAFWDYITPKEVLRDADDPIIHWVRGTECLFSSPEQVEGKGYVRAGPDVLNDLGVAYVLRYHHYLRTERTIEPEDHVLLNLLTDGNGWWVMTQSLLVMEKMDMLNLERKARIYRMERLVDQMRRYLVDRTRPGRRFPHPDDYDEKRRQYL